MYKDIKPKVQGDKLIGYDYVTELEAIKNSLRNIFLVNKNEVPGKPNFGNPLKMELFDLFDDFSVTTIETAIKNEVELFEPRVHVEYVNVVMAPEYNRIIVELVYSVLLYNNVYKDALYIPFSHNSLTAVDTRKEISVKSR